MTLLLQLSYVDEGSWFLLLLVTATLTVASGLQYLWRGLNRAGTRPA
jgi:hypothetical protein